MEHLNNEIDTFKEQLSFVPIIIMQILSNTKFHLKH